MNYGSVATIVALATAGLSRVAMANLQDEIASMLGPPPSAPRARPSEDAGASATPAAALSLEALRVAIEKNHSKLLSLFKAWDEDKNGKINKKEVRRCSHRHMLLSSCSARRTLHSSLYPR